MFRDIFSEKIYFYLYRYEESNELIFGEECFLMLILSYLMIEHKVRAIVIEEPANAAQ